MPELDDVAATLELLKDKEAEYSKRKATLDKKDAASQVGALQDLIIRYQRQSIDTLMHLLAERDKMSTMWETFVENVVTCREALSDAEGAVSSAKTQRERELELQNSKLAVELESTKDDVRLLAKRVKNLLGEV